MKPKSQMHIRTKRIGIESTHAYSEDVSIETDYFLNNILFLSILMS